MTPCLQEIDRTALKVQRAASRVRSLRKKRSEFEHTVAGRLQRRSCSAAPRGQGDKTKAKPHRVVRSATRTCLARGLVETSADVPAIVFLDGVGWRKPSAAPMMTYGAAGSMGVDDECRVLETFEECPWAELAADGKEADTDTTASGDSDSDPSADGKGADTDTTASGDPDSDASADRSPLGPKKPRRSPERAIARKPQEPPSAEGAKDEGLDAEEDGPKDAPKSAPQEFEEQAPVPACGRPCKSEPLTKREAALCGLARHLRVQAAEEHARAQAAEAKRSALEAKCREDQHTRCSERREGLRCERQLAASLRRKRNRETQVAALKQKADRVLQDAKAAKEHAEAEAIAARARHLALANVEAQQRAEALAAVEIARAQAEVDELVERRLADVAGMEAAARRGAKAEAQAMRAEAEREASAAKTEAVQMQLQVLSEVQALKVRAEVEARVIKARAALEARDLRADADADRRAHAERLHLQAEQRAAEAPRAVSAAASLQWAKDLQRQQAKQHRKVAEQERRREQVLEREVQECRARAEEEAQAIRAQALAGAEALRAKAREEALAAKARVEAQAWRRAEKEAAAVREAAEATARDIRDRAREEVEALLAQREFQQDEPTQAAPDAVAVSQAAGKEEQPAHPACAEWEVLIDDLEAGDWSIVA